MIRVAIIGAGIGAEHLAAYAQLPDRFTVTTICDLDLDRARSLADRFASVAGPIEVTDSFDSVLDAEVDLIDVCLPPHLHLDACVAALTRGKHVICEKPLVASLTEADLLAEARAASGRLVLPVFQYRFGLGTAQYRALAEADLVGMPLVATLETHWNRSSDYYAVDWRGTWATERGGAILGHAIHIHDLLTHLWGPVASVHAELATRVNDIEVEDCAALAIRMGNGALVTSSVTLGAAQDMSRLRLVSDRLTVESDQSPYAPAAAGWSFRSRNRDQQAEVDRIVASVGDAPVGYVGLFDAAADAIEGAPGREVTEADGRASLAFVTAVYESARSGQRAELPIGPNHPLYQSWLPDGP